MKIVCWEPAEPIARVGRMSHFSGRGVEVEPSSSTTRSSSRSLRSWGTRRRFVARPQLRRRASPRACACLLRADGRKCLSVAARVGGCVAGACGLSGRCCLGCVLACARPVCPFQLNSCEGVFVVKAGPLSCLAWRGGDTVLQVGSYVRYNTGICGIDTTFDSFRHPL